MSAYEKNILIIYGDAGKHWLAQLSTLIQEISLSWELKQLKPVENLSHNYVLFGFQHERPIILKLSPESIVLNKEISALEAFSGYGVVRVLAHGNHALLLERAVSGQSLKMFWPYQEEQATTIVCECIKRLHQAPTPANSHFPHLNEWFALLDEEWPIPSLYLQEARKQKEILFQTTKSIKLLHGDLHHENILQNGDTWIVIDPKGVLGDEVYDLAAYLRNPMPQLLSTEDSLAGLLNQRIKRNCGTT
ncbi:Fructosamine-3-kinase [Legionella hackeliae]|uniref:aminoglycoside phosphotransferase family protein n=1 Tax=Legionella hackeliae TaxID=449 RepID=UPI000E16EF6A|nr:aminoglycoside phosphotransferase family protein [Legionella hackeliae]STX47853.1 Fructosamine-3-kinase [Legionella hackeliae]